MGYALYNTGTEMYWTKTGWTKDIDEAELFSDKLFAELGAEGLSEFGYIEVQKIESTNDE